MTQDPDVDASDQTTSTSSPTTTMVVGTSFDSFFSANYAPVTRALSLALGNDDLGRDAAAEGFARALQRWGKVAHYDNPPGWVYRAGLNWARSRWRKTRHEVAPTKAERADIARRGTERDDSGDAIRPALERLTAEHRDVIVAKYYLDWSEQQIADALAIRPGTVKSRLSRALERLASELDTDR